jgi:hypothetical protein
VLKNKEKNELRNYVNTISLVVFVLLLYLPSKSIAGKITGTVTVKGLRSPANVLIYLAKAPKISMNLSKAKFIIDQQNLTFVPHTVHFPNNDKVDHNVFSLSRTKPFNLGSYKPGEIKTVTFDKPGMVELRCDVHAEMAAYIMVMKSPYFAVTDDKGQFEIPDSKYLGGNGINGIRDLSPGKYVLKTRHEKLKTKKEIVMIPDNGDISVQVDLTRGTPSVLYK